MNLADQIRQHIAIGAGALIGEGPRIGVGVTAIIDLGYEPRRGYHRSLQRHPKHGVLFAAGCRLLTLAKARQHWGSGYTGDRAVGDSYLRLLDYAEGEARALGWLVAP